MELTRLCSNLIEHAANADHEYSSAPIWGTKDIGSEQVKCWRETLYQIDVLEGKMDGIRWAMEDRRAELHRKIDQSGGQDAD